MIIAELHASLYRLSLPLHLKQTCVWVDSGGGGGRAERCPGKAATNLDYVTGPSSSIRMEIIKFYFIQV